MSFGLALVLAGVTLAFAPVRLARRAVIGGALLLVAGVVHDTAQQDALMEVRDLFGQLGPLGLVGDDPTARALLLGGLVWCGPAADLVVRLALDKTGLPGPETAAEAGFGAGRWIGRLERWVIVACVAAGQPGLAALPIGGKALFRYAEVVADTRSNQPRVTPPDATAGSPGRDALVEYVIVGSLASWAQAIALGLIAAGAT